MTSSFYYQKKYFSLTLYTDCLHTSSLPAELMHMGLLDNCYTGLSSSTNFYSTKKIIFLELTPYSNLKNISIQLKNHKKEGKFHICIKKVPCAENRNRGWRSYRISISADIKNSARWGPQQPHQTLKLDFKHLLWVTGGPASLHRSSNHIIMHICAETLWKCVSLLYHVLSVAAAAGICGDVKWKLLRKNILYVLWDGIKMKRFMKMHARNSLRSDL